MRLPHPSYRWPFLIVPSLHRRWDTPETLCPGTRRWAWPCRNVTAPLCSACRCGPYPGWGTGLKRHRDIKYVLTIHNIYMIPGDHLTSWTSDVRPETFSHRRLWAQRALRTSWTPDSLWTAPRLLTAGTEVGMLMINRLIAVKNLTDLNDNISVII